MDGVLQHGSMEEKKFYSLETSTGQLCITNMESRKVELYLLPDKQVCYITYDGQNFWYTVSGSTDIVCWNREQGVVRRYHTQGCDDYDKEMLLYEGIFYAAGRIFLYERNCRTIYMLDKEKGEVGKFYEIKSERAIWGAMKVKCAGGKLVCMLQTVGEIVLIDLETLEVRQCSENFNLNKETQKYMYEIAFERNALLYEEAEAADLELLLQYCMK